MCSKQAEKAVSVRGVGKRYHSNELLTAHETAREYLAERFGGRRRRGESAVDQGFWALREVSFHASAGERVAILGRNGAGKSTLLKILARVTAPTTGTAELHGTIATLLDFGAGFHPDLTGEENVFLAGAIAGARRAEIQSYLEPIKEFADIGDYFDRPLKRYSSGMYVRLAISLALHLRQDIFLLDEVLGSGDAGFRSRCAARLRSLCDEGSTVILASHHLALIRELCTRVLVIDQGRLVLDTEDVESGLREYFKYCDRRWQTEGRPE